MLDISRVNESYEVLHHTPVGICIINQDYEIIFWNKTLENWTEQQREQILQNKLVDIFPHLNTPKYLSRIEMVLKGGAPTIFSSQLHKNFFPSKLPDGSNRVQHTTVASIPSIENRNEHYACIVVEDVSELTKRVQDYKAMRDQLLEENEQRQKAEKAMRESENRLRAFMDSATECFILCDSKLNIFEINQAGENIFNIEGTIDKIKKNTSLNSLCKVFQESEWQDLFKSVISKGNASEKIINLFHPEQGELKIDINVFKVNEGLGIIAEDITERSNYESKLQYTLSELKRSNEELEQFGYIISHDLHEPLRMVSGYLQLISRKYKSKLDKDADEFIQYAVDGAARMQKMIKGLLRFSQFSKQTQNFCKTDLNQIVQNVLKDLSLYIGENQAKFEVAQLPSIMADSTQIAQLFLNLINNAIKFRSEDIPIIQIGSKKIETEWVISIKDNGIGIPEKDKERVFGIFQKLHTFNDYEGTGLGLTICKKIIERHQGRIWVESKPGIGSTFFFALPIQMESAET